MLTKRALAAAMVLTACQSGPVHATVLIADPTGGSNGPDVIIQVAARHMDGLVPWLQGRIGGEDPGGGGNGPKGP